MICSYFLNDPEAIKILEEGVILTPEIEGEH